MSDLFISIYMTALGFLAYLISKTVYNLFFSPLRNIPGPFIAKITQSWLLFVDAAGKRTSTIHELHRRYGSSVRIGPSEVSFANAESIARIYGQQSAFVKAPVYQKLSLKPEGIFSLIDKQEHSERRKLLSHVFSQSNLLQTEPLIKNHISTVLGIIHSNIGGQLDVFRLFRSLSLDIVGEIFFGQDLGALKEFPQSPDFAEDVDSMFLFSGIGIAFPIISKVIQYIPVSAIQRLVHAKHRVAEYGRVAFHNYIQKYGRKAERKDLFTKILSATGKESDQPMTDLETYTEAANLVLAGTDTTSTTLTYLFWELSLHPQWQEKVRKEVREKVNATKSKLPSSSDLEELHCLDAVISEALRLHPAAPSSLWRIDNEAAHIIDGYVIPAKTVVSVQCYTTQRDPSAFDDPDKFRPEKWLEPQSKATKDLFMPFSRGPRACLGKNMAMLELKLITAAILQSFKITPAPSTTEKSMTMVDHFLVVPYAGKCDLIFTRAD